MQIKRSNIKRKSSDVRNKQKNVNNLKITKKTIDSVTPMLELINELKMHQLELEKQNEELQLSKHNALEAVTKYAKFYDFAPVGYFTIDSKGRIEELNFFGSSMLGKDKSMLAGRLLGMYFTDETKPVFYDFLKDIFTLKKIQTCDLALISDPENPVYVHLSGYLNENGLSCIVAMSDYTEKKLDHKKLLETIVQTEEKEKTYFSNEIHDGLGPLLSAVKFYLELSKKTKNSKEATMYINEALEIIDLAYVEVHEISNKMSPHLLSDFGLIPALKNFISKINKTHKLNIHLKSDVKRQLDKKPEIILYRTVIECITNTLKHACAKNIYIKIHDGGEKLHLDYKDDGRGFNIDKILSSQKGIGLLNIKNRVITMDGSFFMDSEPGQGVNYRITLRA